jgi:DNA-binding transcriptional ArsR family regulator
MGTFWLLFGNRTVSKERLLLAVTDAVFKALADPTRREILSLLRGGGSTVGDIASNFQMSRPAVSKHLRQLRAAGLITDRPVGTARVCELNAEPLHEIDDWLTEYRRFWKSSLARLKAHVEDGHKRRRPNRLSNRKGTSHGDR